MLGLRKINRNGIHYNFQWPLEVGAIATAPDWRPDDICGGGLHVFPEGIGDLGMLDGYYWAVVEFDETRAIDLHGKAKVESCKIIHLSESPEGLLEFFPKMKNPTQEQAYDWALNIGDEDYMLQFITDSEWAYCWARYIGDREHMRQFITDSEWAYLWARGIGDREHMRQFVTDSCWAYFWAHNIGDKEHMRQFVTDPEYVYYWERYIGDEEHMQQFINN